MTKSWIETRHKQASVKPSYVKQLIARARVEHLGNCCSFFYQMKDLDERGFKLSKKQAESLQKVVSFTIKAARKKALRQAPYETKFHNKLDTIYNPIKN